MEEENILEQLEQMADEGYREHLLAHYPSPGRWVIGVPAESLHELAREYACRSDWRQVVDCLLSGDSYEEVLLQALVMGYAQTQADEAFERIAAFVRKIDSNLLCDAACLSFRVACSEPERMLRFLKGYLKSPRVYEQRFAIVMLLDYYVNTDYIDRTLQIYAGFGTDILSPSSSEAGDKATPPLQGGPGEAVDGLAWGMTVCFLAYPEKTLQVLRSVEWSRALFHQVVDHILHSPRIPMSYRPLLQDLLETQPSRRLAAGGQSSTDRSAEHTDAGVVPEKS